MKNEKSFLTSIEDTKDLNLEKQKGFGPGPGLGPERNGKSPHRREQMAAVGRNAPLVQH